ncbi:MAG TPA: carbohydrate porin [Caulobacteraceae bacterium]|nr:carbohydrate porin [Caulobacteraceae bacterium]
MDCPAHRRGARRALGALGLALALHTGVMAADGAANAPETYALHAQATITEQAHPAFSSAYRGPLSLDPAARGDETADVTLYAGARPWRGAEIWINPEIDQGFGLSNTVGVAGFPSGEAYKVGARDPYLKLPRLFLRQTIDLGGDQAKVDGDLNVLGGAQTAKRLVVTIGKFSVADVFDANGYAHDPRQDFMNWALIDTGTFDYAADAWGYSAGGAVEWYEGPWTVRAGLFDLSNVPNSQALDARFDQFQTVGEIERRYSLGGRAGKVTLTGFVSRGRMGRFSDAVALSRATGQPADIALVRRYQTRTGVSFNLEQALTDHLGLFIRAGEADGALETYEFADIDQTFAVGLSQSGDPWTRPDDNVGLALLINQISTAHQAYQNAGGSGILIGDGKLPHAGAETIIETYYSLAVIKGLHLSADYQFVENPAYNRDRGPVSVFGLRLHAQY